MSSSCKPYTREDSNKSCAAAPDLGCLRLSRCICLSLNRACPCSAEGTRAFRRLLEPLLMKDNGSKPRARICRTYLVHNHGCFELKLDVAAIHRPCAQQRSRHASVDPFLRSLRFSLWLSPPPSGKIESRVSLNDDTMLLYLTLKIKIVIVTGSGRFHAMEASCHSSSHQGLRSRSSYQASLS